MATSGYQAVVPVYTGIDSTAAIALVLQRAVAEDRRNRPFVRDVSDIFFKLKQRGFRFRDLGLRKIPGGYYSEDVEGFVGQLLSMGYATQRSPIKLTMQGKEFCETIVERQGNKEEMGRLREEVDRIMQQIPASV